MGRIHFCLPRCPVVHCRPMLFRLLSLSVLLVHCSTSATITLQDKREIVATITGSSKEEIQFSTSDGSTTLARSKIADIDHPGKFHMLLGASLFVAGIVTFIAIDQKDCRDSCVQPATGIALPVLAGAAGAGIFFWGYSTWSDSRAALLPGVQNNGGGVGYQYRF